MDNSVSRVAFSTDKENLHCLLLIWLLGQLNFFSKQVFWMQDEGDDTNNNLGDGDDDDECRHGGE